MSHGHEQIIGSTSAVSGSGLLLAGTFLHPMHADPHDSVAAFTEYAADHLWVASHLTQLAGVVLMVAALLVLARELDRGRSRAWSILGAAGAIVSLAIATALQAVDGVALKVMVDAWAAASGAQKEIAFQAAFAVRQVEVGFASMFSLSMGLTVTIFGVAMLAGRTYPKWMGWLAITGGVPTTFGGVVMAYTGFSGMAMAINMPASSILLAWMLALGVLMWHRRELRADETAV